MKTTLILLFVCVASYGQELRYNREPFLLLEESIEKPKLSSFPYMDTVYLQPQIINIPQETHYTSAGILLTTFFIVNNMNDNTHAQRFTVYLSGAVLSTAVFFIERKLFYKQMKKHIPWK